MDRKRNVVLGLSLALSVVTTGCLPTKGTLTPQDKLSVATMALEAGATLARLGKAQVMAAGSYPGCVVMEIVSASLSSASEATLAGALKTHVLPSVDVDLSGCKLLADKKTENSDGAQEVQKIYGLYVHPVLEIVSDRIENSKAISCRNRAIINASFSYADVALEPILEEIANPDGKFEIPQIPLDLSKCTDA